MKNINELISETLDMMSEQGYDPNEFSSAQGKFGKIISGIRKVVATPERLKVKKQMDAFKAQQADPWKAYKEKGIGDLDTADRYTKLSRNIKQLDKAAGMPEPTGTDVGGKALVTNMPDPTGTDKSSEELKKTLARKSAENMPDPTGTDKSSEELKKTLAKKASEKTNVGDKAKSAVSKVTDVIKQHPYAAGAAGAALAAGLGALALRKYLKKKKQQTKEK